MALLAAMALVVALGVPALAAQPAHAEGRPPGGNITDPVVRNVDIAAPSVVRILMVYFASLRFDLCGKIASVPSSGSAGIVSEGSGAFISAHGDILTAGHVVDESKSWLEGGAFEVFAPDIADLLNANATCLHLTTPLTPDDIANGAVQILGIPYQSTITQPVLHVFRSTNYTGPITLSGNATHLSQIINGVPHQEAKVLAFSEFAKDDLAVIHVDLNDTPSIAFDDASQVAPQDKLTILGYPGNGDVEDVIGAILPTNLFTLSINTVTVSAIKQNVDGEQLIQVGGNVEHGDSGGPALNAAGHVVGVVSFGGIDSPDGTAFMRGANSVQPLIQEAGVDVKPGAFQQAWQQAFNDYAATDAGHWHRAASELESLANKYPDFAAVQPYKAYAESAASRESLSAASQAPDPVVLGGVAAGLVVLLLALGIVLWLANRRRARTAAAARAYSGAPGSYSYPSVPPYGGPGMPTGGPQSGAPGYGQGQYGPGQGPNSGPYQGQYPSGVPTPAQVQRTGPVRNDSNR